MPWLIGAFVTYGIVVLLIGIAVIAYLLGGRSAGFGADPDRASIRRVPRYSYPLARPGQDRAPGTRNLAYR